MSLRLTEAVTEFPVNDTVITPETISTESAPVVKAKKPKAKVGVAKKEPKVKKTLDRTKGDVDKEIRWTPIKTNMVKSMNKLNATSVMTSRSAAEIAKASGGKVTEEQVRFQNNPVFCLVAQDIVKIADMEDGRKYYLSAKGKKIAEKS